MRKTIYILFVMLNLIGCSNYKSVLIKMSKNPTEICCVQKLDATEFDDIKTILSARFLEDGNIVCFYEKMDSNRAYVILNESCEIIFKFEMNNLVTENDFMVKNGLLFFSGYGHSHISKIDAYTGFLIEQINGDGKIFNTGNEDKGGLSKRVFLPYDSKSRNEICVENIGGDCSVNWNTEKLNIAKKFLIHGASIGRSDEEAVLILSSDDNEHLFCGIYSFTKKRIIELFETEYQKVENVARCLISPDKKLFVFYESITDNNELRCYILNLKNKSIQTETIECNSQFLLNPDWSFDSTSFIITDYENNCFYIVKEAS